MGFRPQDQFKFHRCVGLVANASDYILGELGEFVFLLPN
jgi:hypothetical protein